MAKYSDGDIPDVYVQGRKFWEKHADSVKLAFSHGIGYKNAVALHIRRGDYLNAHNFHVDLWKTDYYERAVAMFPDEKFIVFCKDNQSSEQDTKDREWCNENLPHLVGNRWEFAPWENSETDDLNLMASCKHIIMANSSFSWWAAFLNPNPHKAVVCPKNWFVDGNQRTELLPEWTLI